MARGPRSKGPTRNPSRELQELFTLGQPLVTEQNVRNGALALAGWYVDWEKATATFIDERWASLGAGQKVSFLGKKVYRYNEVVDAIVDHPDAPIHRGQAVVPLVGTNPSAEKLGALAKTYRASGLDNRRLVEAIVRDPVFLRKRHTRPRYPIEWVIAAMSAMGMAGQRQRMVDLLWESGNLPSTRRRSRAGPPACAG